MTSNVIYYQIAEGAASFLPKRVAHGLVLGVGRVWARFFSKDMENVKANLRHALPDAAGEEDLTRLARRLVVNFGSYLVDLLYAYKLSEDFIKRNVRLEGRHYLDTELSRKKGAILVSAHLGNWEFGGMTLSTLGYPLYGIALRHRNPAIDAIFQKRRARTGLGVISMEGSLKSCYKIIRENKILALNGDRLFGEEGIGVNFMGKPVLFPQGFSRISLFTGAAVLPVFFVTTGYNRYRMEIGKPLETGSAQELCQRFADIVQEKIRQYPTQWFIFQPFWEKPQWPN